MILHFVIQGGMLDFRVTKERIASMRGTLTNNKWVSFDKAVKLTKQSGKHAEMTTKIIRCLPSMEDVEWYVIHEFERMGISYLKTTR